MRITRGNKFCRLTFSLSKILEIKFRPLKNIIGVFLFASCASVFGQTTNPASGLTEEQRFNITLEALSRLQGAETNPAVRAVIEKTLTKTRGTPRFVQLVKQLQLKNQDEGLM